MYDKTGLITSQESLSKKLSRWSKSKEIECFNYVTNSLMQI